jgi:transposase
MNNQSKVQMQPAADSASSGASQGARRATEDAPEAARRVSPSTDSEVVPVAKRKRFTNAQKRSIVIAANACTKPGDIGALMRRHGVYSSSLSTWRRQYAAGELDADNAKKRGPQPNPARAELKQLALVTRERDKLRQQLTNAKLVIEVQKKLRDCWSKSKCPRSPRSLNGWRSGAHPGARQCWRLPRHGGLAWCTGSLR